MVEAQVYGDGNKNVAAQTGSWVKVIAPDEFAEEMKTKLKNMLENYVK